MTDPYDADGMVDGGHAGSPLESFDPDQLIGPDDIVVHSLQGPALAVSGPRQMVFKDEAPGDTSDGYHTFDELYEHRRALTSVLATIGAINKDSWRSKRHHPDDGPMFDGHFIVGIELPDGTIAYHFELEHWDRFSAVPELEHAPKWDGADSNDTILLLDAFTRHLKDAIDTGNAVVVAARGAADKLVETEESK